MARIWRAFGADLAQMIWRAFGADLAQIGAKSAENRQFLFLRRNALRDALKPAEICRFLILPIR